MHIDWSIIGLQSDNKYDKECRFYRPGSKEFTEVNFITTIDSIKFHFKFDTFDTWNALPVNKHSTRAVLFEYHFTCYDMISLFTLRV